MLCKTQNISISMSSRSLKDLCTVKKIVAVFHRFYCIISLVSFLWDMGIRLKRVTQSKTVPCPEINVLGVCDQVRHNPSFSSTETSKNAEILYRKSITITCLTLVLIRLWGSVSWSDVGAQWLSCRVLDLRLRGCGFKPHRRPCLVSLRKSHLS